MKFIFSRILSAGLIGITAEPVYVEADICNGLPGFYMVGLLSSEVREARERVRSAIKNSGISLPPKRITINLSPANKRKEGTAFDLPIAVSILCSIGAIPNEKLEDTMFIGELSLNGFTKKINGVLNMVLMAKKQKIKTVILPIENYKEASIISGVKIIGVKSINDVIDILNGIKKEYKFNNQKQESKSMQRKESAYDFKYIQGQEGVKRAVKIAVAGMHNILFIGEPGAGKSIIAKAITTILPNLTPEEALEVSGIYSVMGLLPAGDLLERRPFRSVHHTITPIALAGGGINPKPGEITMAHRGVLFLDEVPEFKRETLEILRQPMEDHKIIISRKEGNYEYPSDFMVAGAMNPCPCGYYPDRSRCNCSQHDIDRYVNKIRGALIDRIDICIETPKIKVVELQQVKNSESSAEILKSVEKVREIQLERYKSENILFNSALTIDNIEKYCRLGDKELRLMEKIYNKMNLSARGYHKIIKVSRTIADMESSSKIKEEHILEAAAYRNFVV